MRTLSRLAIRVAMLAALLGSGCASLGDRGSPPHLEKIVLREALARYQFFYPSFYFTDPDGDVDMVHRRVIAVEGKLPNFNPTSRIDIAPDLQKRGAVWVGGWACGPNPFTTTVEAYLTDKRGNRSNTLTYTVVCRGSDVLR